MIYVQALQELGLVFELLAYLLFGGIVGILVGGYLRFTNRNKSNKNELIIEESSEEVKKVAEESSEEIEAETIEEKIEEVNNNFIYEEPENKKLKSIF